MRKAIIALLAFNIVALSACNTVRGVGRDVESVADTVDKHT